MALSVHLDTFEVSTGVATTTQQRTGYPDQPKAVIVFYSGRTGTVDAAGRFSFDMGVGIAVSPTSRAVCFNQSSDAQASSDCDRGHRTDSIVATITPNNTTGVGSIDGLLDISSFNSDGITFIVDDQFTNAISLAVVSLGGSDITNAAIVEFTEATATGDQDITTVGFQPDCVILISAMSSNAAPTIVTGAGIVIGVAAGATPANFVWNARSRDAQTSSDTGTYCRSGECLAAIDASNMASTTKHASITAWLSNGFRLNYTEADASTRRYFALCLKGGSYRADSLLTQLDTTTDIVESGFGFTPKGAIIVSGSRAESTADTPTANYEWSMGAFSSSTNRVCHSTLDSDADPDTIVGAIIEFDEVYANPTDSSGAVTALMDIKSIESDGFIMIMDDADPSPQRFAFYLAFGDGGVSISNTGIASAETFGTAKLNLKIINSAIASLEAFGTANVSVKIGVSGIASQESFGTSKVNQQVAPTGITSVEAFGTASISSASANIAPAGIASAEAFGTATLQDRYFLQSKKQGNNGVDGINGTSAASVAVTLDQNVQVGNVIVIGATWGSNQTPTVTDNLGNTYNVLRTRDYDSVNVQALGYWYAHVTTGGACTVSVNFSPNVGWHGMIAVEYRNLVTSNVLDVQTGQVGMIGASPDNMLSGTVATTSPDLGVGICSNTSGSTITAGTAWALRSVLAAWGVAIGDHFQASGTSLQSVFTSTSSTQAINTVVGLRASGVAQTITASAIASAEAFGTSKVNLNIAASGIGSAEALGAPTVQRGNVNISLTGIASAESVPSPSLQVRITLTGIVSSEGFGTPQINRRMSMVGMDSVAAFGTSSMNFQLAMFGIATQSGQFANDTFTDSDSTVLSSHTGENSLTWTKHPDASYSASTASIQSNRIFQSGTVAYYSSAAPLTADYSVKATVHGISVITVSAGVVGRMDTSGNTCYMARYRDGTNWQLAKIVAGTITQLGAGTYADVIGVGESREVELKMLGDSIKLFVNGVERISATDAVITAKGKAGVRFSGAATSTSGYHIDNFSVGQEFGSAKINLNLAMSGIASSQAFGTATLNLKVVNTGIASSEAFGTTIVSQGGAGQTITNTGIASAESFGTLQVNRTLPLTGIASNETFGSHSLRYVITNTGIASLQAFGTAALNRTLPVNGIASGEALGNPVVSAGGATIQVTAIASAETFGVLQLNRTLPASGIPSAEGFGSHSLRYVITNTGIASAQAFGTATLNRTLPMIGIASAESIGNAVVSAGGATIQANGIASGQAFGTLQVNRTLPLNAIPSAEAFGSTSVRYVITSVGIGSLEAFGTLQVNRTLPATGIASAEAMGSPVVSAGGATIQGIGIASNQAFGTLQINRTLPITGILTAEAFGTLYVNLKITASGITSLETFGTTKINLNIAATGIASSQAFGTTVVSPGNVNVSMTGIASGQTFGNPVIQTGAFIVQPNGLASLEAFGTPKLNLKINNTGIASSQAFGNALLNLKITNSAIGSLESFGAAKLNLNISSQGIGSQQVFGTPILQLGGVNISVTAIASTEAFGSHVIQAGVFNIVASSIPSAEAFGNSSLQRGGVSVSPSSIASEQAFGTLKTVLYLRPSAIASQQSVNNPSLQVGNVNIAPSSIGSLQAFGNAVLQTGNVNIAVSGIPSSESFGTHNLVRTIAATGIASNEIFGTLTVQRGNVNVIPSGIISGQTFGTTMVQRQDFFTEGISGGFSGPSAPSGFSGPSSASGFN